MSRRPRSFDGHRVRSMKLRSVIDCEVRYSPPQFLLNPEHGVSGDGRRLAHF